MDQQHSHYTPPPNSRPPYQTTTQPPRRPYPPPRRAPRSRSRENWGLVIIAIVMLGFTIVGSIGLIFVLTAVRNDDASTDEVAAEQPDPTSVIYNNLTPEGIVNLTATPTINNDIEISVTPTPQTLGETPTPAAGLLEDSLYIEPWDGKERFTVLVMGLDNRPGQQGGTCRTDTMMIISIDPVQRRIGILSIPRDTYVDVPNYGLSRVNAACTIGNVRDPGSGPRLAMQTVQYNFGIRINDYLMVDFDTFISFIDRIGGIDVMVERTIDDPTYPNMNYGYDPFYLEAGQQHLDGETALKYARSRHDSPEGDIDRAERQQQILFAVRDKVLNVNMLDDLLVQSPVLWEEFESGISTGLTLEQIVRLAVYAKDIPSDKIIKGVVTYEYLIGYRTESGGSVLIPNRNKLISLMLEVFGEGYDE